MRVPDSSFFEFLDDWRLTRGEKIIPPRVAVQLTELIRTILAAPEHPFELTIGSPDGTGRTAAVRNTGGPGPRPEEANDLDETEDQPLSLSLDDLRVAAKPEYRPRDIGGTSDIALLGRAFEARQNVLIEGPPGSGKTLVTKAFAYSLGLPYYSIDASDSGEVDDWIGRYVKVGRAWTWRDGPLTAMCRQGGVFCANELNSFRADAVTRFHGLLDSRRLALPEFDGRTIDADSKFFFVATANHRGDGGRPLTARLRDRFQVCLFFDYDRDIEMEICQDPGILRAFSALRGDRRIRTPASTRLLVNLLENRKTYGAPVAFRLLLNHFREDERSLVLETFSGASPRAYASPRESETEEARPKIYAR